MIRIVRNLPAGLLILCAVLLLSPVSTNAGPALDEVLNYMFVDQGVPMQSFNCEFTPGRTITLTENQPIGQVFAVGMETEKIARIRAYVRATSEWDPGEGVKMVVWDSPQKETIIGQYTIWYSFRGFAFNVAEFDVNCTVSPGHSYYLELSYVDDGSSGDGQVAPIGVMNGQFYYNIWQRVLHVDQSKPQSGDGSTWAKSFKTITEAINAINDKPVAQGYLNGQISDFDLCFQVHGKRRMDRIGNLKKAFARFRLDLPQFADIKKTVDKQDFETAISKTVSYFETRQTPFPIVNATTVPNPNPSYDLTAGEKAMNNEFFGDTSYGYVGPDINWRPVISFNENGDPISSGFTMNRYGPRGTLVNAYLNTGDNKYAGKLNDLLLDWFRDNPPPETSKIGGVGGDDVWSSLNTGIRIAHGFIAYDRAHASPAFTTDCRMGYIFDLADHCDTLIWNGTYAGGNWAATQDSALFAFALNYQEFTNWQLWFDAACERMNASIEQDILDDGVENESAPGYQRWMYYNPLLSMYKLALERGVTSPFTVGLKDTLEKFAEYFMYLYMPNRMTPEFGDWGDANANFLLSDAELYDRRDMLYVGTSGAQGTKPAKTFKLYPNFGTVTMRSHWGDTGEAFDQARYMFFHGLNIGGHGHNDLNSLTCYAYGRELLTDPGAYIYGSPEHTLLCKAESHNLMTIDGQDQPGSSTPYQNYFDNPIADYVDSNRPNAYTTGSYRREVFFIHPNGDAVQDYWVIRDTAGGSGTHNMQQRWHFNPTTVTVDGSLTAKTGFADDGNLAIMQVTPSRLTAQQSTIDSWRPRGNSDPPAQLPTVIYTANAALPASIDTVLFPYDGPTMPSVQLQTLESSSDGRESVFTLTQGTVTDLFAIRAAAGSKTISGQNVTFNGERLFLRKVNGTPKSAILINGTSLTVNGQQVINLPSAQPYTMVTF